MYVYIVVSVDFIPIFLVFFFIEKCEIFIVKFATILILVSMHFYYQVFNMFITKCTNFAIFFKTFTYLGFHAFYLQICIFYCEMLLI